jgi:hypothetical protein
MFPPDMFHARNYSRSDYDGMSPDQFHGCLDMLWKAVEGVPINGRNVFEIVRDELARLRANEQIQQPTESPSQ